MATILRSLKFVRKLNIGSSGRRLGSRALQQLHSIRPPRTQPLASLGTQDRNYVTKAATTESYNHHENVDLMLNNLDKKIKIYGSIAKKDVEQVLRVITEKGSVTSTQALLLIRCCGEFVYTESVKTREELIKHVWDTINGMSVQVDVSHYNSLLLVYLDNETDFSPVDILMSMKKQNIEPNRVTFQRLIEQYCSKGDIVGATKILEHMSAQDIPINEIIFNSLIKGHSVTGDIESAVKILEIMKQAGIEPTSRSYTMVLCAHAKRGDIETIRNVLQECKQKDILLENKAILEIIYTLALNEHLEHVDEIKSLLVEEFTFNKEVIPVIHRLIEKDCLDTAFKLLMSLVKNYKSIENNKSNIEHGNFFIRKMVTSNTKPETIVKYCKIIIQENLNGNPFTLALYTAYTNDMHHLALPLLKGLKESGGDVREHYFYPIFVSYSKENNLQGILNTIKTMVFDFNILPLITTLKDYVIPFMVETPVANCKILEDNKIPFSIASNATLLHLLFENKTLQASKFVTSVPFSFRTALLVPQLVHAVYFTKDVKSFAEILHHQYIQKLFNNNSDESNEDLNAKQFVKETLMKILDKFKHDPETTIQIIKALSEKGINIDSQVAEKMKLQVGQNLTPEISDIINVLESEKLTPVPLNRRRTFLNVQDIRKADLVNFEKSSENCLESKILLLQAYARLNNHEKVANILMELEKENPTYTLGVCASLIEYYSKLDKLEDAEKWYKKIEEMNPEFKLDKSKILNYATLLVNNKRIDDAAAVLNRPINDINKVRVFLCDKFLSSVRENFPDRVDEFFHLLVNKQYCIEISSQLLGQLIRTPFEAGDITKAIDKFRWACEKYKMTPQRNVIMKKLIKDEDAKLLQHVTDLCTQVHGEMNALFDLAIAFFECDRPRQARKILETPGLRLRKERVFETAELFHNKGDTELLEKYINLMNGLFFDMDCLYILLLKGYEWKGEWEKCLSLWTQMQEDNIAPSPEFMSCLESILKKCKQEIPFASPIDSSDLSMKSANLNSKQKNQEFYLSLIKTCLDNNNIDGALENFIKRASDFSVLNSRTIPVITNLLSKLIEKNDFNGVFELTYRLNNYQQRAMQINYLLNTHCSKTGKYKEYIEHLESNLDDSTKNIYLIRMLFHSETAAREMLDNPEMEQKINAFAIKAIEKNIHSPIFTVWLHKFLKGNSEAESIWEQHLKNVQYFPGTRILKICTDRDALSKLPEIIEKLAIMGNDNNNYRRKINFEKMLKTVLDSEESNKYQLLYDCLRQMAKMISLESINLGLMETIEKSLPADLSIQGLKTEKEERTQKASG